MKKSKQTEEDMLYGTAIRTPTKRRVLTTPTSNKTRKVKTQFLTDFTDDARFSPDPPSASSTV